MDAVRPNWRTFTGGPGSEARPTDLDAVRKAGYEATVDAWLAGLAYPDSEASKVATPSVVGLDWRLLNTPEGPHKAAILAEAAAQGPVLACWWVARMVAASNPLTEKLPLLLHNLFPTAIAKVFWPKMMLVQNELFRSRGWGRFDDLVRAVAYDPAMLLWLDGIVRAQNLANENFSRELMERFTMGIGTYTQADVTAAASCFTGMTYDATKEAGRFDEVEHDPTPRRFLGQDGFSTPEQVIRAVTHSRVSHAYVPSRLWSWLAWPVAPGDPVLAQLVKSYGEDLSVARLLKGIFLHPDFRSVAATAGLIKQPIEYVAGVLRALDFSPASIAAGDPDVYPALADMGQIPFDPPSVGGWKQNQAWLTSASALGRWRFATEVVGRPDADIALVADSAPRDRPDAVAELLSVASWSPQTMAGLVGVADDPVAVVTLALVAPEYATN